MNLLQYLHENVEVKVNEDCEPNCKCKKCSYVDIDDENDSIEEDAGGDYAYNTPFAFSDEIEDPEDSVYTRRLESVFNKYLTRIDEVSYSTFKNGLDKNNLVPNKINTMITDIYKNIESIDETMKHLVKYKEETNIPSSQYYKGTKKTLTKINSKLNILSNKIREFSK